METSSLGSGAGSGFSSFGSISPADIDSAK